ncbi:MAG TPA: hypothetical protein VIM73_10190, partial [Polyangiaceae bacterium]
AMALLEELNAVAVDGPLAVPSAAPQPEHPEASRARAIPAEVPARGRAPMLGVATLAALVGVGGGYALWKSFGSSEPASSGTAAIARPPTATTLSSASLPSDRVAPSGENETEVHFVLFPLDARVFRGEEDLGQMPVSLLVRKGEPVTVTVRRKGFSTRKVVVDGSEQRLVIGLVKSAPEGASATTRSSPVKRAPQRSPASQSR